MTTKAKIIIAIVAGFLLLGLIGLIGAATSPEPAETPGQPVQTPAPTQPTPQPEPDQAPSPTPPADQATSDHHLALVKEVGDCQLLSDYPEYDAAAYECHNFEVGQALLRVFGPAAPRGAWSIACDLTDGASLVGPDPYRFCVPSNNGPDPLNEIIDRLKALDPGAEFAIWQK